MIKNIAIGFGLGIILTLCLYFFWHIPEMNKSYKKGYTDALLIIRQDTSIIKKPDSTISVSIPTKPNKPSIAQGDSVLNLSQTFISDSGDTISVLAKTKDVHTGLFLTEFKKTEKICGETIKTIVKVLPCDSVNMNGYFTRYELQPFSLAIGATVLSVFLLLISLFAPP